MLKRHTLSIVTKCTVESQSYRAFAINIDFTAMYGVSRSSAQGMDRGCTLESPLNGHQWSVF